jgi:hypothetical protein
MNKLLKDWGERGEEKGRCSVRKVSSACGCRNGKERMNIFGEKREPDLVMY